MVAPHNSGLRKTNAYATMLHAPVESSPLSRSVSAVDLQRDPVSFSSVTDLKRTESIPDPAINSLEKYYLDFPESDEDAWKLLHDEESPYYATEKVTDYSPKNLLPYKTESLRDQAKYLSHIITNIYSSTKSLDLKGRVNISVADLLKAKKELKLKFNSTVKSNKTAVDVNFEDSDMSDDGRESGDEAEFTSEHHSDDYDDDDDDDDEEDEDDEFEDGYESDDELINVEGTPINKLDEKISPIINLRNWTKELNNLLATQFPIPLACSALLIKVYYSIILSRGQSLDVDFYFGTLKLLLREEDLLYKKGLQLEWRSIFEEVLANCHMPDSSISINSEGRVKKLCSVAQYVSPFFDKTELPEMFEMIMSKYKQDNVSHIFSYISSLLPVVLDEPKINEDGTATYTPSDIRHYLPVIFNCWSNHFVDDGIAHLSVFVAAVAKQSLHDMSLNPKLGYMGQYGILTKDQFEYCVSKLARCFMASVTPRKLESYVSSIFEIICYSLTSEYGLMEDGIFDKLVSCIKPLTTVAHPSTSGGWSEGVALAVSTISGSIHARLMKESKDKSLTKKYLSDLSNLPDSVKLSTEIVDKVISLLQPLINLGVQSKSSKIRNKYIRSLKLLTFIRPEKTLDPVLLDIYASFESVNSTHRITVVLRELETLVRFMVELPAYRVHVPRLLSMLVPGIDSNDPAKTIRTIELVQVVASVLPFVDLTKGEGDGGFAALDFTNQHLAYLESKFYESSPRELNSIYGDSIPEKFPYDPEFELQALKSASSTFEEFIRTFCEGCFKYLENSPDVQGDTEIESEAAMTIPRAFDALIESLSDELYDVLVDQFFRYVTENVKHQVALVFCELASFIIRRAPEKYFDKFFNFFLSQMKEEIKHGAGRSRAGLEVLLKDARLIWYTKLLSGACLGASSYVIPYMPQIEEFVKDSMIDMKGEASFSLSMLIQATFSGITTIRLMERRLISDSYIKKNGIDERCWGAFQFSPERLNVDNLDFKWYIPDKASIEVATKSFDAISMKSVEMIYNLMEDDLADASKTSLESLDQVAALLYTLQGALSGACMLFDPHYKSRKTIHGVKHRTGISSEFMTASPSLENLSKDTVSSPMDMETREPSPVEEIELKFDGPNISAPDPDAMSISEESKLDDITLQGDGGIEIVDAASAGDEDIEMVNSGLESGVETPSLDDLTSTDASFTGRPASLYNFGYYFDRDPIVNHMDASYIRLHQAREKIGKCLHDLTHFLMKRDGSIELISILISTVGTWLRRCGQFDSSSLSFIENASVAELLDISFLKKPYSRFIVGARLALLHYKRINMVRSLRVPSDLDKVLIKDLVSICASPYTSNFYTACIVLNKTFRKIMSCTHLIFGIFKDWEMSISTKSIESLKNILKLFFLKRLKGLPESNPKYLLKYEDLLVRSIELDDPDVSRDAFKLYSRISKSVRVPERMCIIDWSTIDAIKPVDETNYVEGNIKAVVLAKNKKRQVYYDLAKRLEKRVLERVDSDTLQWKFMTIAIALLKELQLHLELPLNGDVLKVIGKSISGNHPEVCDNSVAQITRILRFTCLKAELNYNEYQFVTLHPETKRFSPLKDIIGDTASVEDILKEFKNIENPRFFVDNKLALLGPCFNKNQLVVNGEKFDNLNFSEDDERSIRDFGLMINKTVILDFMKLHANESETEIAFSVNLVHFIKYIFLLSYYGYTPNFSYTDFFEIIDEIYTPDVIHTHLIVVEIFAGLLISSKENIDIEPIDKLVSEKIKEIFSSEMSEVVAGVWDIFCYWVPLMADHHRYPHTTRAICEFDIDVDEQSSPFMIKSRVGFLSKFLTSCMDHFYNFDGVIETLFNSLAHPYDTVARSVATALSLCLEFTSYKTYGNFTEYYKVITDADGGSGIDMREANNMHPLFRKHLIAYLEKIRLSRPANIDRMTPQELSRTEYIYAIRGLERLSAGGFVSSHKKGTVFGILFPVCGPMVYPIVKDYIFSIVFDLESRKDVCEISGLNPFNIVYMIGNLRFSKKDEEEFIHLMLNKFNIVAPTFSQSKLMLNSMSMFYIGQTLRLPFEQRKSLIGYLIKELYSQHVEIREMAADCLCIFLRSYLALNTDELSRIYIQQFTKVLNKKNGRKRSANSRFTSDEVTQMHGATLGLGAIIEAFPYTTPPPKWFPEVLATIARKSAGVEGIVGKTAKNILSSFKKTRQDTWHIDSKFFSEEQMEDLEGVLWKSYFI